MVKKCPIFWSNYNPNLRSYGQLLSLFFCNGYSHAIFTILFYESQAKTRKAFTKEKKNTKGHANDSFIAVLFLFYDLKYINSTKTGFLIINWAWWPSNFDSKYDINIITKFRVSIFKMMKLIKWQGR